MPDGYLPVLAAAEREQRENYERVLRLRDAMMHWRSMGFRPLEAILMASARHGCDEGIRSSSLRWVMTNTKIHVGDLV